MIQHRASSVEGIGATVLKGLRRALNLKERRERDGEREKERERERGRERGRERERERSVGVWVAKILLLPTSPSKHIPVFVIDCRFN